MGVLIELYGRLRYEAMVARGLGRMEEATRLAIGAGKIKAQIESYIY